MSDLSPLAFDIETSGLEPGSIITVAGIAIKMGAWFVLNTTDRNTDVNADRLAAAVEGESGSNVRVSVFHDEHGLLTGLADFAANTVNGERHYLTVHTRECWPDGFDLSLTKVRSRGSP